MFALNNLIVTQREFSLIYKNKKQNKKTITKQNQTNMSISPVVAQSVERATPGEEVPGSIPAVATHPLLVGSVSV